MKRTLILAGVIGMSLALTSCKIVINPESELVIGESNLDLNGITRLEATSFNGKITVQGGSERGHVKITRKGATEVRLSRDGAGTLKLEAVKNANPCFNCGVTLELDLPAGLDLKLSSSNGPIDVSDSGSVDLGTSNGAITVNRARGEIRAHTSNGSITVNGAALPANSSNSLETSNGTVSVSGVSAPQGLSVTASTSNGPSSFTLPGFEVTMDAHSFRAIKAGQAAASLDLHTSNGAISVR